MCTCMCAGGEECVQGRVGVCACMCAGEGEECVHVCRGEWGVCACVHGRVGNVCKGRVCACV